jgi:hypothetical protein
MATENRKRAADGANRCYLCGTPLRSYTLASGEKPPPDFRTRDHIPPEGLFPSPKPNNLFVVPCCFRCNTQHSGFDERLRIVASMPFDRNQTGQKILDQRVIGGTLAKGRQMRFMAGLLACMTPVRERPEIVRAGIEAKDFQAGMVRITKGLLYGLYPGFDYRKSRFCATYITQESCDEQLKLMALLKQAQHFERGQGVFQCWRFVDEAQGAGMWMLVFYECFGYFVFHSNGAELDRLHEWLVPES